MKGVYRKNVEARNSKQFNAGISEKSREIAGFGMQTTSHNRYPGLFENFVLMFLGSLRKEVLEQSGCLRLMLSVLGV